MILTFTASSVGGREDLNNSSYHINSSVLPHKCISTHVVTPTLHYNWPLFDPFSVSLLEIRPLLCPQLIYFALGVKVYVCVCLVCLETILVVMCVSSDVCSSALNRPCRHTHKIYICKPHTCVCVTHGLYWWILHAGPYISDYTFLCQFLLLFSSKCESFQGGETFCFQEKCSLFL